MEQKVKKTASGKIIAFVAIVMLIVYLVLQLSNFLSKDVKIASLRDYVLEDTIPAKMLIYKDETVIESGISGGCDYLVANGQKVSVNEKVAYIYKNLDSPELLNNVRNLELQIDSYNDMIDSESAFDYDVKKLDASIDENINSILDVVDKGNIPDLSKDLSELKKLLHKRGLIDGNTVDVSATIQELQNQLNSVINQNSGSMATITAKTSGFFCTDYDGLEGMAPLSISKNMSVERFENILDMKTTTQAPSGYVGTVVTGFEWTGAFEIPAEYEINKDDFIKIRLSDYSDEAFYIQVDSVSASKGGNKIVTVSSKDHLDILTLSRIQNMEVIEQVYTGYRVSRDAIKTVDSKTGVFVLKGQILSFQPVEIVYSGEDFVIITAADGGVVYSNDDVVLSGKNLYDGKVVTSKPR